MRWPVDNVRVTQTFGDTSFSRSGAYNGKGHNGIDLAASIGTPLKAALSGVVVGTGNTDTVRGCYSFGKWAMIKHGNGLSTMYAHMSQIGVSTGNRLPPDNLLDIPARQATRPVRTYTLACMSRAPHKS